MGGFAHELRKRLWALHTGVKMEEVEDPLHPDVFENIWKNTALLNSDIFAQVLLFKFIIFILCYLVAQIFMFFLSGVWDRNSRKSEKIRTHPPINAV